MTVQPLEAQKTGPIYGQIRVSVDGDETFFLRVAAGTQYFPAFGYNDFNREIDVNRSGGEWTTAVQVGFDFIR